MHQKKLIGNGFYIQYYAKLETVSKQLGGWLKFLLSKKEEKYL